MTQQQTHKALYIVGFFASLSLISIVFTMPYTWKWFYVFPLQLFGSIVGDIFIIILIIAPFVRKNMFLFVIVPLSVMMSFFGLIHDLYQDFFDPRFYLVNTGFVPALFTWVVYVLMNFTGLLFLCLRSYGYIKERRAGLITKF